VIWQSPLANSNRALSALAVKRENIPDHGPLTPRSALAIKLESTPITTHFGDAGATRPKQAYQMHIYRATALCSGRA
jgi:hypothetical protein